MRDMDQTIDVNKLGDKPDEKAPWLLCSQLSARGPK